MQLCLGDIGVGKHLQSHVVQALQCTYAGSADGYGLATVGKQFLQGLPTHGDILRVHLVPGYLLALHRLERAGTYVERQFLAVYMMGIEVGQHLRRKVETGCRGGHAAFYLGVDRLVSGLVALLRLAVEIRRYGQFAHRLDNLRERDRGPVPLQQYLVAGAMQLATRSPDRQRLAANGNGTAERTLLPLLQVAHEAVP